MLIVKFFVEMNDNEKKDFEKELHDMEVKHKDHEKVRIQISIFGKNKF